MRLGDSVLGVLSACVANPISCSFITPSSDDGAKEAEHIELEETLLIVSLVYRCLDVVRRRRRRNSL